MKIFIILLSLFLVSCMTVPKLPVKDKRIAIIIDDNEKIAYVMSILASQSLTISRQSMPCQQI